MGQRKSLVVFRGLLLATAACFVPALDLDGKICSQSDPCPPPFICVGSTASPSGLCRQDHSPGEDGTRAATLAAAGSIACNPNFPEFNGGNGSSSGGCLMKQTASLIDSMKPDAVLVLGDAQRSAGALAEYQTSYALAWGRFKSITHPTPSFADYYTAGALGYFGYFGANAGSPSTGYYSFDLGSWHIISLNAQCSEVGGCQAGSAQEQWLRQDLAAHPTVCVLAFWGQPRFSSTTSNASYAAFWQALYDHGADVVLNGGVKNYERTAAMSPDGGADSDRGIRQFVVGTGGIGGFDGFHALLPTTERAQTDSFGVLELSLKEGSYDFRFVATSGDAFTDEGSGVCH